MNLILRMTSSLVIWLFMFLLIVLIILLPRDAQFVWNGHKTVVDYHMTWKAYEKNITQYADEVKMGQGLGTNSVFDVPVSWELKHYGARSAGVLIPAFAISVLLGIYKGVFDYKNRRGKWKLFGEPVTWIGQAVPDFFLIICLQEAIWYVLIHTIGFFEMYGNDHLYNYIMPILFISMYPISIIATYTKKALEEEDEQEYICTVRAKGIPENIILWRHILRNSVPKLMQHFMPVMFVLISGMFVVELLTHFKGIGTGLLYSFSIVGSMRDGTQSIKVDTPSAIGFSMLFLMVFLAAQWVSQIMTYYANPVRKEGRR